MYRLAAEGKGALISENFANLQRLSLGDVLDIPTPSGVLRLPVVGVVRDWSDQLGTILIDRHVFVERWRDDSVNLFRLYLAPDTAEEPVKARILARYADSTHLFVLNNRDVRAYIMGLAEQWVGLTNGQIFVAVLVAVLGIANALTVSIIDRRRELGILQAVGALHRQIRQTVWIEAMTIATIGLVLGLALGAINLQYVLDILRRDVGGLSIGYAYPVRVALVMIPVILVAALVSTIGPAESAIRGTVARSLEYE
jgi:putative ABC transport system permease protein